MMSSKKIAQLYFPAFVVFLVTMAFMPVVDAENLMSGSLGLSRAIELGLLLASASLLVIAIIMQHCSLSLKSLAAVIVMMYGIWALSSFLWSANPILSFGKGLELVLTYFIGIALVVYIKGVSDLNERQLVIVVSVGLISAIIFLLLSNVVISGSPIQFTAAMEWSGRQGRFYLGNSHPLETAELLLLAIVCVFLLPINPTARLALILMLAVLLVLTNGRNLILTCPVVIGCVMYHRGSTVVRTAVAACAIAVFLIFVIFLVSGEVVKRLPNDFWTLNSRIPLWSKSVEFITDEPFLGVGYFASRYYILKYFTFAGHAHNSFVEAALTTGIIGLSLILIILIYAISVVLKTRHSLLLGVLLSSCLGGVFNPVLIIPNVTTFLLVLSLVAAAEGATEEVVQSTVQSGSD